MTTLKMNLRNDAVTQYGGYPFTSMCMFMGRPIGAGPDGIFTLDGGNRDVFTVDTDERKIPAWFELPVSQLGLDRIKQCRRLYVGGEFDGQMKITAKTTGHKEQVKEYKAIPRNTKLVQHVFEVPTSFMQQSEYWQFTVANINGSDFSIDFIDGTFLVMVRRLGL